MATHLTISTAIILLLARSGAAQQSSISMDPASGSLSLNNSTGRVEVTCGPPPGESGLLISLNIKRVLHKTQQEQKLAGAVLSGEAGDTGPAQDLSSGKGIASGSLQQRTITFTMTDATCADGGMYICDAVYIVGTIPISPPATNSKNLSVIVNPGQLTMTADPQQTVYNYNTSLLLRCNGPVGTVDDDTQIEWMWEYKVEDGFLWTQVTTTEDNFNEESSVPTGPGNCGRNHVVTLQRSVTQDDTGRTYRCYVRRVVGPGGSFEQFAGEYTIGTVLAPGDTNTGGNTGANSGDPETPSKANVGAIVGGVVGGLIVIVIVVVLVYFLVIRKRRNRDRTDEVDPSKPADEREPYPYPSNNADVTYSKPNRFRDRGGHTNKAMDEPTNEKPPPSYETKPARYENERERERYSRGSHNPSYYPDEENGPRTRRYSSDDGGTDSRVNTSMHSMGDGDPTMGTAI